MKKLILLLFIVPMINLACDKSHDARDMEDEDNKTEIPDKPDDPDGKDHDDDIVEANLPYSEGGIETEYPDPHGNVIRYVDAAYGNDNWDGSKDQPWQSLNKAVTALASLPFGTHVLLRRGRTWNATWQTNNFNGTEGKRYVLGAYGPLSEPKPAIIGDVRIRYGSWWIVRDLDIKGQLTFFMTNNSIILKNEVHGWDSNGIAVQGGTHHIAVIQNLVYDGNSNDPISIHDSSSKTIPEEIYLKNCYWIVDNTVIGNTGIEECIDVAGNGWRNGIDCPQDIKIINNRLQCKAVPPSTRTGACNRPFSLAHTNKYVWVIGNTGTNGNGEGIYNTDASTNGYFLNYFQFSSNILFNNGKSAFSTSAGHVSIKHNTLLCSPDRVAVSFAKNSSEIAFHRNLIHGPGGIFSFAEEIQIPSIDFNWYSPSAPSPMVQSDSRSQSGVPAGITVPADSPYNNDPQNWDKSDFLDHFIPDASWKGNNMSIVPGAFRADGTRQGMNMESFPGCGNNGYGWHGPLIIQARYSLPVNVSE